MAHLIDKSFRRQISRTAEHGKADNKTRWEKMGKLQQTEAYLIDKPFRRQIGRAAELLAGDDILHAKTLLKPALDRHTALATLALEEIRGRAGEVLHPDGCLADEAFRLEID